MTTLTNDMHITSLVHRQYARNPSFRDIAEKLINTFPSTCSKSEQRYRTHSTSLVMALFMFYSELNGLNLTLRQTFTTTNQQFGTRTIL